MSAKRFYNDKVVSSEGYIPPDVYNAPAVWETPIPFDEYKLPTFPVEVLPRVLTDLLDADGEWMDIELSDIVDWAGKYVGAVLRITVHSISPK